MSLNIKKKINKQPGVVIYARFSPRKEAENCESNINQIAEATKWATEKGMPIKGIFQDDSIHGDDMKNCKGLFAAIDELQTGDILLIRSWDRLSRDLRKNETIVYEVNRKGASIYAISQKETCSPTPEGNFIRQVLACTAAYQKALIGIRTSIGMKRRQLQGDKMSSNPPYGFKFAGKKLKPIPEEIELVKTIEALHNQGLSIYQITSALKQLGKKTRTDKPFHYQQVKNIVSRGFEIIKQLG